MRVAGKKQYGLIGQTDERNYLIEIAVKHIWSNGTELEVG